MIKAQDQKHTKAHTGNDSGSFTGYNTGGTKPQT